MVEVKNKDIYSHSESVLFRQEDSNRILIVNSQFDELFEIDQIAAEVFLSFNGKKTLEAIKKELIKKYSPPKVQFEKDIIHLIKELLTNKLITKH